MLNYPLIERPPKMNEVDLAFAITATSATADQTFRKMKDTVNAILNQFGQDKVKYALIVFGGSAAVKVNFKDTFTKDEDLRKFIDSVPRTSGGPDFVKALGEANKLFAAGGRPDAQRILVVITDKKSTNSLTDLRSASAPLEAYKVRVVTVAVGKEADAKELEAITPVNNDLLVSDGDEQSTELAKKIADRLVKSK